MRKKKIFLGAGILAMLLCAPVMAANSTENVSAQTTVQTRQTEVSFDGGRWKWDGKAFHCYQENREISIQNYISSVKDYQGYIKIGANYYCLDNNGVPKVGHKILSNGYTYYFSPKSEIPGAMVRNSWATGTDSYGTWWRYYYSSGKRKDFNGNSSYAALRLDSKKSSSIAAGAFYILNKKGYIVGPNKLKKVKCADGKEYYCYTGANKALVKNKAITVNGKKYYIKYNYKMARSEFVKYNGNYYYYGSNYQLAKNVFISYRGSYYYIDKYGKAAVGVIKDSQGKITAYANTNRRLIKGWKTISGNIYYFNSKGRAVRSQPMKYGSSWGYINSSGCWKKAGWYIKKQSDGTEKRYYISPQNGTFYKNCWKTINGLNYYFMSDGSICTKVDRLPGVSFSGYNLSVNNERCIMTVYSSDWKTPIRVFTVSTGRDATPTPNGIFRITSTGQRWTTLMGPSYGQWASHFSGGCFMHSVPCYTPSVYTMRRPDFCLLGTKQSHGCIRMTVSDVYWVYTHCNGGLIRISNSESVPLGPGEHHWVPENQTYDPTDWNVPENHLSGPVWD